MWEPARRSEAPLSPPSPPQDGSKITKPDCTPGSGAPALSTHVFTDDSKSKQILCFPAFISDEKIITYANLYVNSVWPRGSWHAASGGSLAVVSGLMLQIEKAQISQDKWEVIQDSDLCFPFLVSVASTAGAISPGYPGPELTVSPRPGLGF